MNKGVKQPFLINAEAQTTVVNFNGPTQTKETGRGLFTRAPHYKLLTTTLVSYRNRDCPHW